MKNHFKTCLVFLFLFFIGRGVTEAQEHQLIKKWETDTLLKVPESVLYDAAGKVLYVSNIDGQDPWAADGKGSIGKVSLDGKIIAVDWVTGLNAPKGLGLYQDRLYAADLDKVVVIDIKEGKISQTLAVDGAEGLNDIAIDKNGVVYVSDSKAKRVYRIENGKAAVFLENLKRPNGLFAGKEGWYVLDDGIMFMAAPGTALQKITDGMEGGTDGIENVTGSDYIVSCWAGVIWYVKGDGTKVKLLDTREQKINSADIGYDAENRIVYVPTFWKNNIVAYDLR
ncbi:MAG: ATP/GTP-binding protein [Chitinophagaceae bacterium]|nr:ATP/GTP-binding protein [Chitinophagaceae bacterium]